MTEEAEARARAEVELEAMGSKLSQVPALSLRAPLALDGGPRSGSPEGALCEKQVTELAKQNIKRLSEENAELKQRFG